MSAIDLAGTAQPYFELFPGENMKYDETVDEKDKMLRTLTSVRKLDHIRICLTRNVESLRKEPGFSDVELVHNALPEVDFCDVKTDTELFGRKVSAPIIIAGMTGGHPIATRINEALAKAAQKTGIGMGVGSQRAAIEDTSLSESYSIVRKVAPDVPIIANIGAPQLSEGYGVAEARRAVQMVEADALAIHLNSLQEVVQTEGDTNIAGVLGKIHDIASELEVPVIAKETGSGIAYEEAQRLTDADVRGIDIGGAGGTSWSAVEAYRELAQTSEEVGGSHPGFVFRDWGIPTAASIVEVSAANVATIIATGGVRDGIDVAKSIALGAHCAGLALPFLKPAYSGDQEALETKIMSIIRELRTTMYLTSSKRLSDLAKTNLVIRGELAGWLSAREFDVRSFARRGTIPKR